MLGPILRGNVISLEPPRLEDATLRLRWFADIEVTRLYDPPGVRTLKQEEELFERAARDEAAFVWRIVRHGETIGTASLKHIDWFPRQASTTMLIGDRKHWGRGYGSEAVRLRTAFAFGEIGLERIETSSMAENIGMHRALERSGFHRIAVRAHQSYFQGEWHDEYIYELLRGEWLELPTLDRTKVQSATRG